MRDVVVGTVTGVSAVLLMWVLRPAAAPPPGRAVQTPLSDVAGEREAVTADLTRRILLTPTTTRPMGDAVRRQLARTIPTVDVTRMRLDKVLDQFAETAGVNLHVHWRALEAAGINVDLPITIKLRGVTAEQVLRRILDDVGGGNIKLEYRLDEGVVDVSTAEDFSLYTVTRVYDVRDLVEDALARDRAQHGAAAGKTEADVVDGLKMVIEQVAHPGWDGPQTFGYFAGRLIVIRTPEEQEKVSELLMALRRAK